MSDRLQEVVASALQIAPDDVTDDMEFNSAPNWDSLNHITLMLSLEEAYGISISDDDVVELTSVGAIREYVGRVTGAQGSASA